MAGEIKIFSLSNGNDYVAAFDSESAIKCLMEETDYTREECLDGGEVYPLNDQQMDELKFIDEDGEEPDCTFKEQLEKEKAQGRTIPYLFASREQ